MCIKYTFIDFILNINFFFFFQFVCLHGNFYNLLDTIESNASACIFVFIFDRSLFFLMFRLGVLRTSVKLAYELVTFDLMSLGDENRSGLTQANAYHYFFFFLFRVAVFKK